MQFIFYLAGLIAIISALRVLTNTNPVHALVYLIICLCALSMVFFSLGSYFVGALEIIVYAGAILVLFLFAIIMLNLGTSIVEHEKSRIQLKTLVLPIIISIELFAIIIYALTTIKNSKIRGATISAKEVGISLFGPYMLTVELISLLLLAGLIVAFHIGRKK
ncbi:NADH-quinone oxidoreductase subunit J [Arsenophonus sp.]|uniref:NADH-quinone oxidoreductase subunit J n=1 Tax=Arsenophonus sp. TaxID=1872640 RepID=UPI00285B46D0|nr:NADH-quinone oxidoreductase subunit J [Arsenophonus sp.]MDR5617825.1 NADH-quinone oxidoreductase subunit J [Arsenophonus sp.]